MNAQFLSTRIINDVKPIMQKRGYIKYIHPQAFVYICQLFYDKVINNRQFKDLITIELEEVNKT